MTVWWSCLGKGWYCGAALVDLGRGLIGRAIHTTVRVRTFLRLMYMCLSVIMPIVQCIFMTDPLDPSYITKEFYAQQVPR